MNENMNVFRLVVGLCMMVFGFYRMGKAYNDYMEAESLRIQSIANQQEIDMKNFLIALNNNFQKIDD